MGNICSSDYPHRIESLKYPSIQDFEILKFLGKGGFAKVLLVRNRSRIFALKVIKKDRTESIGLLPTIEQEILAEVQSPFIVKLHYTFESGRKLFLILDFMAGGSLTQVIKQNTALSEPQTVFYTAEIICALESLHSHNYSYRDLKPDNVLLDSKGHIKISDFNLCKRGGLSTSFAGTAEYMAPEVITGHTQTFAVDFWSLGICIYEMLTGRTPFWCINKHNLFNRILNEPVNLQGFSHITSDLIYSLLDKNPSNRLQSFDLLKRHPFFDAVDWLAVANKMPEPPLIPQPSARYCTYSTDSSNKVSLRSL